ncbi:MAG: hypothetical protein HBSAPP03_06490 [Phycisphaerae bacterium]|nr:MAG: hypothetical protein HBSAPP03_06490 [Phycisphaerae bacterium]
MRITAVMAVGVAVLGAGLARAQLRPEEVLVIYDSRIPDSRAVAEYYAGSRKVPGGEGGLLGARPGVRVVDLASLGAPITTGPDITYAAFATSLRNPLRAHLASQNLTRELRCFVMTKGLPHRLLDTDTGTAADNPTLLVDEFNASDPTMASVDTELMLLWLDLDAGEAGGPADSKADGAILNPYWKAAVPIRHYPQTNIDTTARTFTASMPGPTWTPTGTAPARILQGDLYLVSRLDAPSVADVRGMIDRAGSIYYDTLTHAAILDESGSNGVADGGPNGEFDNAASAFPSMRDADDYEITRDEILADTRFASAFAQYNAAGGGNQFYVGPLQTWQAGALVHAGPVVLVTSYGANHAGRPSTTGGQIADTIYATSFNLAHGAIINTMESFNGRAFGGLGQNPYVNQMQVSAFLAGGGTFGVGNVWEPLADTVPDSRYLARNFIRGEMSWAEAAASATPAISWMQITLGDPLARAFRSSEDLNADQRRTVDDLYAWEQSPSDVDRNGTINAADRAYVIRAARAWERADLLTGRR